MDTLKLRTKEEVYIFIKIEVTDVTTTTVISRVQRLKTLLKAKITKVALTDCNADEVTSFWSLKSGNAGDEMCFEVVLEPDGSSFMWTEMINADMWYDTLKIIEVVTGNIKQMIVTTHDAPPSCKVGQLVWHENFTLVASDVVGVDDETTFSLLIQALGNAYPLNSVVFHLELNKTDVDELHFGVCELAVYSCDKISLARDRYNVSAINETHSHLLISAEGGKHIEVDATKSEFVITQQESLLVICSDALPVIGNSSVENATVRDDLHSIVQVYLTVIGLSVSIVCLAVTFIMHSIFPSLQTIAGKLLMNLCVALLLAQLLFLISGFWSNEYIVCKVLAVCQHYSWLVSFCWMNVFAVDVSITFVNMKRGVTSPRPKRMIAYALYAWGAPACLCMTAVFIHVFTDLPLTYGWETVPTYSIYDFFYLSIDLLEVACNIKVALSCILQSTYMVT